MAQITAPGDREHLAVAEPPAIGQVDAVTVLSVFVVMLTVVPARFIVGPLGAAGTPAGIMAVLCLFWYLSSMIAARTSPIRGRQPVRTVVVVFCCAMLASYAAANLRSLPGLEANAVDRGLILTAGWAGIALLAADGIPRLDRLEAVRRRLVAGGGFIAALGCLQFFTGLDLAGRLAFPGLTTSTSYTSLLQRDEFNRPMATATHPIEFGVVLAMLLPLALHGAVYARPGRRGRRWFLVAMIVTVLPMTVSRSAILGLAVVCVVILPIWPAMWRITAVIMLGVFMVALRAVVPGLIGTLTSLVSDIGSDSSTVTRTNDYVVLSDTFVHRPWLGQGFGTYLPQTYRILDNQYLLSAVETGVAGVAALLTVLLSGWFLARSARRASRARRDAETAHLAQCFAASMAVALFAFFTFDAFSFPMVSNLTFLLLGCCGALWRLSRPEDGTA
ncbi:O-antigen ligase family protein [Actinomadura rubrisoli]|uniref:O-antigen ligase domain-containing protein n=1 Tax=Actinomadura rubrisoli TaxID=2530368 RepID=A0A4R5BA49_9ACTN|nr:O-antigen ligase family protein [Actinomadura rubrisoli]TDD82365.1 O-antigen ligase domain-containing protein [Actinomadura rubrisoli]